MDFETAMATIHGITPEGDVITGIKVFERAYAAVGLGRVGGGGGVVCSMYPRGNCLRMNICST